MRLRLRHSYDFGPIREQVGTDLLKPAAWDAARSAHGAFSLVENREDWEARSANPDLVRRAHDIAAVAYRLDATRLCSHGVGTAALEFNLLCQAPKLELTCTDYAPWTVDRLSRLFPEVTVILRNLTDPDPPTADLHLMHRLDAELDDVAWRSVFTNLSEPILFVPNAILDLGGAMREVGRRMLKARRLTRAGWSRNEAALRSLWERSHSAQSVTVGTSRAFLLQPRH